MRPYIFAIVTGLVAVILGIAGLPYQVEAQLAVGPAVGGVYDETDFPGSDYRSFSMVDLNAEGCQAVCNRDRQCASWTYVRPGVQGAPRCYLKSAKPTPVRTRCCVSGYAGGTWEAGSNRPGSDFVNFPMPRGSTPTDCFDACRANGSCRAFTYVDANVQGPDAVCWLKNAVPDPVPGRYMTSGVVG